MSGESKSSSFERLLASFEFKPSGRSFSFYRIWVAIGVVATLGLIFVSLYAGDFAAKVFWIAIAVNNVAVFGNIFGEGLHVGAFGERFRQYGQRAWAISQIASLPIPLLVFPAMGYYLASLGGFSEFAGLSIGGVVGLAFCLFGIVSVVRLHRKRSEEDERERQRHERR